MDNRLHPVMQQALCPHIALIESERDAISLEIALWQAGHHARNDLRALRLQVAEQTRNDLNWAML